MERPLLILETATDERLVALARQGDERAFAAIVARYSEPLRRHCRRFLSPASADDAVQQTFINAHAALTAGNAPYALRPWLYRIARNAALNIARVPQIEPIPDELLEPDELDDRERRSPRILGRCERPPSTTPKPWCRVSRNGCWSIAGLRRAVTPMVAALSMMTKPAMPTTG